MKYTRMINILPRNLLLIGSTYVCMAICSRSYGETRLWTSKDGRTLSAEGIYITPKAIVVSLPPNEATIEIPFKSLSSDDVKWAFDNLEIIFNSDIELKAKTASTNQQKFERETGNYAVSVSVFSNGGNAYRAYGRISPITETVKISGRTIEVSLSSLSGDGMVGIEVYTVKGEGTNKSVASVETGVYEFSQRGSQILVDSNVTENLAGWVIVARSLNSGRIIKIVGSMNHLVAFVEAEAKEIVDFSKDRAALKQEILAGINN